MAKIGRNDPCPCGSGKKYKKCCLGKVPEVASARPPEIPFEPDFGFEPNPSCYAEFRIFEQSGDFARLKRRRPKEARRMWTISKVAKLRTEAIARRLNEYGIDASPEAFEADAKDQTSAWAVAEQWFEDGAPRPPDVFEGDFVCLAACELWKRYLPERPSVEVLDDWIHEGYELSARGQAAKACDRWWQAWTVIRERLQPDMNTTDKAASVFDGCQCLSDWTQDLSVDLANASLDHPEYAPRGVEFCEQILAQFKDEPSDLFVTAFRVDLGHFLAEAQRPEAGERIFTALIEEHPDKAVGYANLADHLGHPSKVSGRSADIGRAIEILERALQYPVVDADDYDLDLRLEGFKRAAQEAATPVDTTSAVSTPHA